MIFIEKANFLSLILASYDCPSGIVSWTWLACGWCDMCWI